MEPSSNRDNYYNYPIFKDAANATKIWENAIKELEDCKKTCSKLDAPLSTLQCAINIIQDLANFYEDFYTRHSSDHYNSHWIESHNKKLKGCLNILNDDKPNLDLVINVMKFKCELPISMASMKLL